MSDIQFHTNLSDICLYGALIIKLLLQKKTKKYEKETRFENKNNLFYVKHV